MKEIDKIRKMITANHGGLDGATDGQIRAVWDSLAEDKKAQYLGKTKANAKSNKSKPDT
jgi:hypothetical protein